MRKRIQQIANGKFEYARCPLQISEEKISIEVLEGKDYTGEFVIAGDGKTTIRGVVYPTGSRMECLNPQFEGEEVRIRYQFHSEGLTEGDIQQGEFAIVSDQGEYNLSFVVYITKLYADTSAGKMRNFDDFAHLAEQNLPEAQKLFASSHFKNLLREGEIRERRSYDALERNIHTGQKLEEFLLAFHRKPPVLLSLQKTEQSYYDMEESVQGAVELRRENWGYLDVRVQSDAPFLIPERPYIGEEHFVGNLCHFSYEVREDLLHAGKNFGKLTFVTASGSKKLEFFVTASRGGREQTELGRLQHDIRNAQLQLTQLFLDYGLKKIVTGMWARQTIKLLDYLMPLGVHVPLYTLMKAQALLINRQKQEALWLMEDFKRSWGDHKTPIWGYYLYLCTLAEREPSYVERLTHEIEELCQRYPDDMLLFWVTLFVREDYCHVPSRRLRAIEQWTRSHDCISPCFYLEAYQAYARDPYLLGKLEDFEIRVLFWAVKHDAITADLAEQIIHLTAKERRYNRFLYQILQACYEVEHTDEVLQTIISYLIRGQRFHPDYHNWYEAGIDHELRITNLCEAYLLSLDDRKLVEVPKMIQLYFQYSSTIAWEKRAVLYVNIIADKDKKPKIYDKYQPIIEQFAIEQLKACNISDDLAVIYDELITAGQMKEETARLLSHVLFTHKLTCMDERIARAVIWDERLIKPQIVTFSDGVGYFTAYTELCTINLIPYQEDHVTPVTIVLEDAYGNQFLSGIAYTVEPLMRPSGYIRACMELVPKSVAYALFYLDQKSEIEKTTEFDLSESDCYAAVLNSKNVTERYKAELLMRLLRYDTAADDENAIEGNLLETMLSWADRLPFDAKGRAYLVEFLAKKNRYERAYAIVRNYGYEQIKDETAALLCEYAVKACGYEEDEFLLAFSAHTFAKGHYNGALLSYLALYANGSSKQMAALFAVVKEEQLRYYELCERILTQAVFSGEYVPHLSEVFEEYCAGGGKELICSAYLSEFAHGYLTRGEVVSDTVFRQIEVRYQEGRELNDACRIGLLKYYASREMLSESESEIAERLLEYYIARNVCFSFYLQFDRRIREKFYLYGRCYVEYHAAPSNHVLINYRTDGETEYHREDLIEVYPGIYVREFILFVGEKVQYYLSEYRNDAWQITESALLCAPDDTPHQGSYGQINEMARALQQGDRASAAQAMQRYQTLQQTSEQAFRLL